MKVVFLLFLAGCSALTVHPARILIEQPDQFQKEQDVSTLRGVELEITNQSPYRHGYFYKYMQIPRFPLHKDIDVTWRVGDHGMGEQYGHWMNNPWLLEKHMGRQIFGQCPATLQQMMIQTHHQQNKLDQMELFLQQSVEQHMMPEMQKMEMQQYMQLMEQLQEELGKINREMEMMCQGMQPVSVMVMEKMQMQLLKVQEQIDQCQQVTQQQLMGLQGQRTDMHGDFAFSGGSRLMQMVRNPWLLEKYMGKQTLGQCPATLQQMILQTHHQQNKLDQMELFLQQAIEQDMMPEMEKMQMQQHMQLMEQFQQELGKINREIEMMCQGMQPISVMVMEKMQMKLFKVQQQMDQLCQMQQYQIGSGLQSPFCHMVKNPWLTRMYQMYQYPGQQTPRFWRMQTMGQGTVRQIPYYQWDEDQY